jgi:hypothetical protein
VTAFNLAQQNISYSVDHTVTLNEETNSAGYEVASGYSG